MLRTKLFMSEIQSRRLSLYFWTPENVQQSTTPPHYHKIGYHILVPDLKVQYPVNKKTKKKPNSGDTFLNTILNFSSRVNRTAKFNSKFNHFDGLN